MEVGPWYFSFFLYVPRLCGLSVVNKTSCFIIFLANFAVSACSVQQSILQSSSFITTKRNPKRTSKFVFYHVKVWRIWFHLFSIPFIHGWEGTGLLARFIQNIVTSHSIILFPFCRWLTTVFTACFPVTNLRLIVVSESCIAVVMWLGCPEIGVTSF
jgi:hypothetical protein